MKLIIASLAALVLLTIAVADVSAAEVDFFIQAEPRVCTNSIIIIKVHNRTVVACPGGWEGHISTANLCSNKYHLCSYKDIAVLNQITFEKALKIPGCYAFNAAQDFGSCKPCKNIQHNDDMAGVGITCPRKTTDQKKSCIKGGTIDAAQNKNSYRTNQGCRYHSGISGVLCCRDKD